MMNKKDDNVHNSDPTEIISNVDASTTMFTTGTYTEDHTEQNHNELKDATDNTPDNIPTEYIAQRSIGTVYNAENQPEYYEYEYDDRDFFAVPGDNQQDDYLDVHLEESQDNESNDYDVYRALNNYKILTGMLIGIISVILASIAFDIRQNMNDTTESSVESSVPTRTTTTTLPNSDTSGGVYNHGHRNNNQNVQIVTTYSEPAEESTGNSTSKSTGEENISTETTTHAHTQTTHKTTEDISTPPQTSYIPTSTRKNVPVIPSMPSLPNVPTMTPHVLPTVTHTAPHNENYNEGNIGNNNRNNNVPESAENDNSNN